GARVGEYADPAVRVRARIELRSDDAERESHEAEAERRDGQLGAAAQDADSHLERVERRDQRGRDQKVERQPTDVADPMRGGHTSPCFGTRWRSSIRAPRAGSGVAMRPRRTAMAGAARLA